MPKAKLTGVIRNTLLEELQEILRLYPDNEQIIKELIQNAEDAEATVVKMVYVEYKAVAESLPHPFCTLSGPALCFYNNSMFSERDWEGIRMVRKSNKQSDPLKVGKFGIGFKSVFHITDCPCVISGGQILFINPLVEEKNPAEVCQYYDLKEMSEEMHLLQSLFGIFDFSEECVKSGNYPNTLFWFPLRRNPSEISENVYNCQKIDDLFRSFGGEIDRNILFLNYLEKIEIYKLENYLRVDCSVQVENVTYIQDKRKNFTKKIKDFEKRQEENSRYILSSEPVWMEMTLNLQVSQGSRSWDERWLVINYFHCEKMCDELFNLIVHPLTKYRPYMGIAARLDLQDGGKLFCSLPLPTSKESSTGLPVHVNGFFALDSNRQHLKWPSYDQTVATAHMENDMLWNQLMVKEIQPVVYKKFINVLAHSCQSDWKILDLFYQFLPRESNVKEHWECIVNEVFDFLLQSNTHIPCLENKHWVRISDAIFVQFGCTEDRIKAVVKHLFNDCTKSIVNIKDHTDILNGLFHRCRALKKTSPRELRELMKENYHYKKYSETEKSDLLCFACSDDNLEELEGLELWHTADGKFRSLQQKLSGSNDMLYLCQDVEIRILVGIENQLVPKPTSHDHLKLFEDVAKSGYYKFKILTPDNCTFIMNELIEKECEKRKSIAKVEKSSAKLFGEIWLTHVWAYLKNHFPDSLSSVQHLRIVPTITSSGIVLCKLSQTLIFHQEVNDDLVAVFDYFKIRVMYSCIDHPLMVPGAGIIKLFTSERMSELLAKNFKIGIQMFNDNSTNCQKDAFIDFLYQIHKTSLQKLRNDLKKLKMFKEFSSVKCFLQYTSLDECKFVYLDKQEFPVVFPQPLVMPTSEQERQLIEVLSNKTKSLADLLEHSLQSYRICSMNEEEIRKLGFYILQNQEQVSNWIKVRDLLSSVAFIKVSSGNLKMAEEIYNTTDDTLNDLFLQEDKFPNENASNKNLLSHLQFRTRESPGFWDDFLRTCRFISDQHCYSKDSVIYKKSEAVITILKQSKNFYSAISHLIATCKVFPYKSARVENYPTALPWYSSGDQILLTPQSIYPQKMAAIVGSVLPVASGPIDEFFERKNDPPLIKVIEHFHNVVTSYNEEEHAEFALMSRIIYRFLASKNCTEIDINSLPNQCIFTDSGFVKPKEVYISTDYQTDLQVGRYLMPLRKEYIQYSDLFEHMGCHPKQCNESLVGVLCRIQQKHLKEEYILDKENDLQILRNVLSHLSNEYDTLPKELKCHLLLPVHNSVNDNISFMEPQKCIYSNLDWLSKTFDHEDEVVFVHQIIEPSIAKRLGARSLTEHTLSDAEEIYSDFGQSDKLTHRLKTLLEDGYTDGLSVPKEIIQNADDAGATIVKFLYDERENRQARTYLIHHNMAECQGPALWAYNDKEFSDDDFKNIQNLNSGSKKEDATKIGKFGLGFNASYNLTDMPSFISGKYLVYLDPHGKFLGETITKNSPGIKLNLQNTLMLRKLENQFIPFQNVFKFQSCDFFEGAHYSGTLFRFPLRTEKQATESEINSKTYSKGEMKRLLHMLCDSAGDLLLFTQNVVELHMYHLSDTDGSPDSEMKLILSIKKDEVQLNSLYPETNMLKCASEHLQNPCEISKPFQVTCNTTIHVNVSNSSDLELTTTSTEVSWLKAWSLGRSDSLNLFTKNESDGALPLACSAIPIHYDGENHLTPRPLGGKSSIAGFYEIGHVFCYLPLPIQTCLPFHINGSFSLSSDRKRILSKSTDDKEFSKHVIWNKSMIEDTVVESIIVLLLNIKDRATSSYQYHSLWPKTNETILNDLEKEFYKFIVSKSVPLFRTLIDWKCFKECLFLDEDLQCDKKLEQIVHSMLKCNPVPGKFVTEIPMDVYNRIQEKGFSDALENQTLSYQHFFIDVFLTGTCSCKISEDDYNYLILMAIRTENDIIKNEIKKRSCIATKPNGSRKEPKLLIDPRKAISRLFLVDDGFFPHEIFNSNDDLDKLINLGMMTTVIPWELLEKQAQSIPSILCGMCAVHRSKNVVKYLNDQGIPDKIPNHILNHLSRSQFLPVMRQPSNWPLLWNNSAFEKIVSRKNTCELHKADHPQPLLFEEPCKLFLSSEMEKVACSMPLLDNADSIQNYCEVLKMLKVNCEQDIDMETLLLQLKATIDGASKADDQFVLSICVSLFDELDKRMDKDELKLFMKSNLSELSCILVGKHFVYPHQVIFSIKHDCSPYFYGLNNSPLQRFKSILSLLGVRDGFSCKEIVDVLCHFKNELEERSLEKDSLELVCRIASLLEDVDETFHNQDVYLPDITGHLLHVSNLCLNDVEWIPTTESMKFLHPRISLEVAKVVGVKTKRAHTIQEDSEPFGDEFGQHEDLTTRINRLLDGYPDDCIMKEFLQNADDARATELHFILDNREHGTEHVFSEEWKNLQGPALCVYNDSVFTEKDIKGIQNLGIGSKIHNPTMTGQYGIGFNVIYHITDVPSFLTRNESLSLDTLCILDPHCKHIGYATEQRPGRMFKNVSEKIKFKYKDVLSCYFDDTCLWNTKQGTLFRFPLRKDNHESRISRKVLKPEDVEQLLHEFKKEMGECLLFLRSVRKIVIASITDKNCLEEKYFVESKLHYDSNEGIYKSIQLSEDSFSVLNTDRREVVYTLNINVNNEVHQKWFVVNIFGLKNKSDLPETVKNEFKQKKIALFPDGSVAFILKHKKIRNENGKMVFSKLPIPTFKAFCFLPLPIETGLPVHINAHFALDHEARRNIWWCNGEELDIKMQWNQFLLEKIVSPAYAKLVLCLKQKIFPGSFTRKPWKQLDKFHKAFPYVRDSNDIWTFTAKTFYRYIFENALDVFPIVYREYDSIDLTANARDSQTQDISKLSEKSLEIRWCSIGRENKMPTYFDNLRSQFAKDTHSQKYHSEYGRSYLDIVKDSTKKSEFLAGIMKDLGMKLVESPMWVFKSLCLSSLNVEAIAPKAILSFLKSFVNDGYDKCLLKEIGVPVQNTKLKGVKEVVSIMWYCLKNEKSLSADDLEGVPLLLTADEHVRQLSRENTIYVFDFPSLLPKSGEEILHLELKKTIIEEQKLFKSFLYDLGIAEFGQLISKNIPCDYFDSNPIEWNKSDKKLPNIEWLQDLWCFLGRKCKEYIAVHRICTSEDQYPPQYEKLSSTIERFIEKVLIQHLGKYNFLPVFTKQNRSSINLLYPIKQSKDVLMITEERQTFIDLNVPRVDILTMQRNTWNTNSDDQNISSLVRSLVALTSNAKEVLNCLCNNLEILTTNTETCDKALDFLKRHLSELPFHRDIKNKLKSLPFYTDISGQLRCLDRTVLILPDEFPIAGLEIFAEKTDVIFLHEKRHLDPLYQYMGYKTIKSTDIYCQFILMQHWHLPHSAKINHLKFIRDNVIPKIQYHEVKAYEQLQMYLQQFPFLPTDHGTEACADQFYNPHKTINKMFCRASELPQTPFDRPEWESFLLVCGVEDKISAKTFLKFAARLQECSNINGITKEVAEMSTVLVETLFEKASSYLWIDKEFLHKMKDIRFIIPFSVPASCTKVAAQHEKGKQLISFNGSTVELSYILIWSNMGILPNSANPSKYNHIPNVMSELGISEEPTPQVFLEHCRKVCVCLRDQLSSLYYSNDECQKTVQSIMSKFYAYLDRVDHIHTKDLDNFPFIYIKDRNVLTVPERVVLNMSEGDEIPPYLFKAPTHFGPYHPLFKRHGAGDTLLSNHYAKVLQTIYEQSKGTILETNQLRDVKKAVQKFFLKIREEEFASLNTILYLPSRGHKLIACDELVFVDNKQLEGRISSALHDIHFFIGFQEMEIKITDPVDEIKAIPAKYRPSLLSAIVKEKVSSDSKFLAVSSDRAKCFEMFLKSSEFCRNICRLVLDVRGKTDTKFTHDVEIEIQEKLQNCKVFQTECLITNLVYQNHILQNSGKKTVLFCSYSTDETELENAFYIYFQTDDKKDLLSWISSISVKFINKLNEYLGGILKENSICVLELLKCINTPDKMEALLDELDIIPATVSDDNKEHSVVELGDEIRLECHCLLDYSFTRPEKGELVAYEIFDPIVDATELENASPTYVYAKILENGEGHSSDMIESDMWNKLYEIDVGKENTMEVKAYKVYRFVKKNGETVNVDVVEGAVVFRWDIDRVMLYIKDMLKGVCGLHICKLRGVVKRLIMQYLPEKHVDNKTFFMKLTQFINYLQSNLEKGETIDDEDVTMTFQESASCEPSNFLTKCLNRVITDAEKQINVTKSQNLHQCVPHPWEARRWFSQAQFDFDAAYNDYEKSHASNWACYKCHQATEKALKALVHMMDSDCAALGTHNISYIALRSDDAELINLIERFESITGHHTKMRYPDAIPERGDKIIPADVYTSEDASKAIDITRQILDIIRPKVNTCMLLLH